MPGGDWQRLLHSLSYLCLTNCANWIGSSIFLHVLRFLSGEHLLSLMSLSGDAKLGIAPKGDLGTEVAVYAFNVARTVE